MSDKKETAVEETIDEMMVDPDSSANSDTSQPPQTIENDDEDASIGKRGS